MSYYVIGVINVENAEAYQPYMQGAFASLQMEGVEALAYGSPEPIEGDSPGERLVLIRFRDKAQCDEWYNSAAYQGVVSVRHANAKTPFLFGIEGLPS